MLSISLEPRIRWKMPFTAAELRNLLEAMLDEASMAGADAELAVIDDAAMEILHRQSLGCDGPTNILSFPAQSTAARSFRLPVPGCRDEEAAFLGNMALSADTLRRESFLYGQSEDVHCIRLLAHGLCHLLGHDHGPVMDALSARLEERALALRAQV